MDLNLIKKLVNIVDSSNVTDLEIEENGLKIKIAKKIRSAAQPSLPHFIQAPLSSEVKVTTAAASDVESKTLSTPEENKNIHEIRSPIVGTFYRAPTPDADPYVKVGDNVSAGIVLCLIEAMKLMNEIECDVSGKIVKVLVENGRPVEYNQPLFLIEKS
ncbi:MAG: acetyl-CoA carboxylase biotin carboxyl carrier protein [Syntrophothermus sp.]|nr:acetyl-CoA carboxylase biotin carboxyl carrier protein [Ignavibacteriaceae bacterium]